MAVNFSDAIIAGTTVFDGKHLVEALDAVNKIADSVKFDIKKGQQRPVIPTEIIENPKFQSRVRFNTSDIGNIRNAINRLESAFSGNCNCIRNNDCCQTCQKLAQCKPDLIVGTGVTLRCQIEICQAFTNQKECSRSCQDSTCQSAICQSIVQCSECAGTNQKQCYECKQADQCKDQGCQQSVQCCEYICQTRVIVDCNNQNQCDGNQTCESCQECERQCY